MRIVRSIVAGLIGLTPVLLSAATARASATGDTTATGDPATIALYTSAANNLNNQSGYAQVSRGAFFLGDSSATNWYLSWDVTRPRYAWQQPVVENSLFAVVHRKIAWDTITWSPACPTGRLCVSTLAPVRFFSEPGASFWAVLNGAHGAATCWYPATKSTAWINQYFNSTTQSPFYVGASPYTYAPHFRPMVRHGGTVTVTSTYDYKYGAHVTEIDTIDARTHFLTESVYHVTAYKSFPGFSVTTATAVASPVLPHIVLCH